MSWLITGTQKVNWTPADITTALWLDAADGSTITTISGAVSQWSDKSGNGRHVVQAIANQRPIVSATQLNGRGVLEFDGSNDTLVNTSVGLPVGSSARTVAVVYQPLRTSSVNAILAQGVARSTGRWFVLQSRSGAQDPYFAGFSADISVAGSPTLTTKIAVGTYDGTTLTLTRDGSTFASAARALDTDGNIFMVGSSADATSEYAQALIAEIVFFSTAISLENRQKLEGYLAHKWGLTANLPSDHPYKINVPVP